MTQQRVVLWSSCQKSLGNKTRSWSSASIIDFLIPSPPPPDLYFTRVTPSKQFDILAEDFDYLLIGSVVVGLVVGTFILSQLAGWKTLKLLWK